MATSKKRKTDRKPVKKKAPQMQALAATEQPLESEEGLKRDLFDDFLFHAADYVYRRRKLFISLAIIIVVIVVSGYGTYRFFQYQINQRNEQLYIIEEYLQKKEITEEKRFEATMPLLNTFIEAHPETSQQHIALFYRSRLNFDQKRYLEAENDLRNLLSLLEDGSDLFVLSSLYLSNVLVDQQKDDQAIKILENARTENMADIVLMALSEIYINTNQKDKAKRTLAVLTNDYPNSLYIQRARQLLSLL